MSFKENRAVRYFYEAKEELGKVAWPSRKEAIRSTLTVIGVSIGIAVYLGALDYGFNVLLEKLVIK